MSSIFGNHSWWAVAPISCNEWLFPYNIVAFATPAFFLEIRFTIAESSMVNLSLLMKLLKIIYAFSSVGNISVSNIRHAQKVLSFGFVKVILYLLFNLYHVLVSRSNRTMENTP
jgi:hypothetical protein